MRAFRFRVLIFVSLYVLGFLAPWQRLPGVRRNTLWLAASTLLARTGWVSLANATVVVTLLALLSLTLGGLLRVWGTSYLGVATMSSATLEGGRIVAAGPYRYLRNPLYLGSWLLALGTAVLMPSTGALFFLPAFLAFTLVLIFAEERFLRTGGGDAYREYCRHVPRLLPRVVPYAAASSLRARWPQALLAEAYPIAFPLCFAVFAWRYNAFILIRCLIICYGVSLILRALFRDTSPAQ